MPPFHQNEQVYAGFYVFTCIDPIPSEGNAAHL